MVGHAPRRPTHVTGGVPGITVRSLGVSATTTRSCRHRKRLPALGTLPGGRLAATWINMTRLPNGAGLQASPSRAEDTDP